ncbi:MAG: DNA-binding protein WhiA [Oscillospiraceae bacterium]|nr:DNA-binding protein WhiA [Oscillospiraceae bacterium]
MSFSGAAKAEVCRVFPNRPCCALAECFGILLYCNSFTADSIKIITESREFAQLLPALFKKAFNVCFDIFPSLEAPGKLVFQITDEEKIAHIMESCGFSPDDTVALHVNLPLVEDDCCKAAFLRGAFLAGGSVTDPGKGYHLEIATTHKSVAMETYVLLRELGDINMKSARRSGGHVLYIKQSDLISDFLTFLGAPVAGMGIITAKLEKELNNKVNRRCNCDDANASKVVEAAQEQLAAIRKLEELGVLDKLPAKLHQAAVARKKHPYSALSELAELMDPPISKPAMNHRLKKLVEYAKEASK